MNITKFRRNILRTLRASDKPLTAATIKQTMDGRPPSSPLAIAATEARLNELYRAGLVTREKDARSAPYQYNLTDDGLSILKENKHDNV